MKKTIWILVFIILIAGIVTMLFKNNLKENKKLDIIKNESDKITKNNLKKNVPQNTVSYFNADYQFSVDIPVGLNYCLNEMCLAQESTVKTNIFKIRSLDFLKYQDPDNSNLKTKNSYLEIKVRPNNLQMSAISFAKHVLELNRKYSNKFKTAYSHEEEINFAGSKAYSFIASGAFEERGAVYDNQGALTIADPNSSFVKKAGESNLLDTPHKIIYFDHQGSIYRIIYPLNNTIARDIIDSFQFDD